MKKIINGKVYDTEKARKLATSEFGELYEKRTKEYFVHIVDKMIDFEEIKPITKEQAEKWIKQEVILDLVSERNMESEDELLGQPWVQGYRSFG